MWLYRLEVMIEGQCPDEDISIEALHQHSESRGRLLKRVHALEALIERKHPNESLSHEELIAVNASRRGLIARVESMTSLFEAHYDTILEFVRNKHL